MFSFFSIISKLRAVKIEYYAAVLIALLIVSLSWSLRQTAKEKKGRLQERFNYESLRDKDSLQVALLRFSTAKDIEKYVSSIKELKEMVATQEVKIKNIKSITYQKQIYVDTIKVTRDITEVVQAIKDNVPITTKWVDSTNCLILKGNVAYSDGKLSVNLTEKKFYNSVVIIAGRQRTQWKFLFIRSRFLGKWKPIITASSVCGKINVTVIEKTE